MWSQTGERAGTARTCLRSGCKSTGATSERHVDRYFEIEQRAVLRERLWVQAQGGTERPPQIHGIFTFKNTHTAVPVITYKESCRAPISRPPWSAVRCVAPCFHLSPQPRTKRNRPSGFSYFALSEKLQFTWRLLAVNKMQRFSWKLKSRKQNIRFRVYYGN